jgi:hypothetical protein
MRETIADNGRSRTDTSASRSELPTVFHITHWKAGSTWLARILGRCDRQRIVRPKQAVAHVLEDPIQPGGVYPRVYLTREQFDQIALPANWRRFVVIRDLRDTLISAYFSVKLSHRENPQNPFLAEDRAQLREMSTQQGLAWMIDRPVITKSAEIQRSWTAAGETLVRYEDLVDQDVGTMQRILIDECEFPLSRPRVRRIVERSRFERLSGGRARGEEDVTSHFRKGLPGDWQRHFDESLKSVFKERWGELLIRAGYESGHDW